MKDGTTLGPYRVLEKLGEGGMGDVYRARDPKLNRDVALKVLPEDFAQDPERLARFKREAQVLASLNHPNIAAIYGLEDSGEKHALVLELVEGPTLQDRISQGAIPLDEALPIAKQIAEALEAAHEQAIIHRDLKPANIKVTPEGVVKVLDFGLAKALEPEQTEADAANSPTMSMTAAATKMGMIMGTAAYMSPEQAKGRPVDKRTDIWAYGVVLFEMLTGRQAFGGTDISETLAAVLRQDMDWADLPSTTPPVIRKLLRRCLTRDRKNRLADMSDARLDIADADGQADPAESAGTTVVAQPALWQRPVPLVVGVAALVAATALAVWSLVGSSPAELPSITRFTVALPDGQSVASNSSRNVAISPSGSHIVYAANGRLYLRSMDADDPVVMPVIEGTRPTLPFFSPDGQWIGFYATRNRQLRKVAITGGAAVTLLDIQLPSGATWGIDDTITFGGADGIGQVPGTGGASTLVIALEGDDERVHGPQVLPGGTHVLYTRTTGDWDDGQIVVHALASGERRVVIDGGSDAQYLATGHLVYALEDNLLAVPFDLDRLEVIGGPVPLVEGIRRALLTGAMNAVVSREGTLVYVEAGTAADLQRSLVWVDRDGREEAIAAPGRAYTNPRISPDGARVALDVRDRGSDIWTWDFAGGILTRLTFGPEQDIFPTWTPDGRRIAFRSGQPGSNRISWRAADGTGTVEPLVEAKDSDQIPLTFSPDADQLLVWEPNNSDLLLLAVDGTGSGQPRPLLATAFAETNAALSPDGRWMAYQSDTSGEFQVYVRPFPNIDDGRWQVSTDGGTQPLWNAEGRELFYVDAESTEQPIRRMFAVPVQTDPTFSYGNPVLLFEGEYATGGSNGRAYDVAADGQRFLMVKEGTAAGSVAQTRMHIVLNWFEELKARVPSGQ